MHYFKRKAVGSRPTQHQADGAVAPRVSGRELAKIGFGLRMSKSKPAPQLMRIVRHTYFVGENMKFDEISDIDIQYPWQSTPTKLIFYAIDHIDRNTEFDHQIAFLLLDVGIETMFKVFLSLDQSITHSKTSYGKRRKAIEGSFYNLVEGVKAATGNELDDSKLEEVKYYHQIRNKLYHQGDGVTATTENLTRYSHLAKDLLKTLLDVDLEAENADATSKDSRDIASLQSSFNEWFRKSVPYRHYTEEIIRELRLDLAAFVGYKRPEWGNPSFVHELKQIWEEYPDDECDDHRTRTENQESRAKRFQDLTGSDLSDYWLIDKFLQDVHLLRLALLLSEVHGKIPSKDVYIYQLACSFSKGSNIEWNEDDWGEWNWTNKENTVDEKKVIYEKITAWVKGLQEEIRKLFDSDSVPNPASS